MIVPITIVQRNYIITLTDRETCKLSNLHDVWIAAEGNYPPLM